MRKILWMVLLTLTMGACSNSQTPSTDTLGSNDAVPGESGDSTDPAVTSAGGGTSAASCVEQYSPETLKNRELALDGVVTKVTSGTAPAQSDEEIFTDDSSVTFRVNKWFKGGSGEEVTLKSTIALSPVISSTQGPSIEVGKRYLVSGDGGFMWSCGFSTDFSEAAEAQWKMALE